ncbi:hypothetical protein C6A37_12900, partial [Desulfobacteraceae bacterium SEEP-SAG9]
VERGFSWHTNLNSLQIRSRQSIYQYPLYSKMHIKIPDALPQAIDPEGGFEDSAVYSLMDVNISSEVCSILSGPAEIRTACFVPILS